MTAHDVVARVRRASKMKQVGHAGTLDPMATGVLPVAIGKACRLLRFLSDDKTYLAGVLFAASTDTDDVEGKILRTSDRIPSLEEIKKSLSQFLGEIDQIPPVYSAVHIQGERAYRLARRGDTDIAIPARRVQVFSIESLGYQKNTGLLQKFKQDQEADLDPDAIKNLEFAELQLRIHCGTGTYIRAIARDLGQSLGSAACLSSLVREQAGSFNLAHAINLDDLAAMSPEMIEQALLPPERVLALPSLEITDRATVRRLLCGQLIKFSEIEAGSAERAKSISKHIPWSHTMGKQSLCAQ